MNTLMVCTKSTIDWRAFEKTLMADGKSIVRYYKGQGLHDWIRIYNNDQVAVIEGDIWAAHSIEVDLRKGKDLVIVLEDEGSLYQNYIELPTDSEFEIVHVTGDKTTSEERLNSKLFRHVKSVKYAKDDLA